MSLGRTRGVVLEGITGSVVDIEADIVSGLPTFMIGGLPDAACRQSGDRVKAAASNSSLSIPTRRITVNLSPAWLPKSGSHLDLGIALAVLAAAGEVEAAAVDGIVHIGELGLDGSVRPVRGVLPLVLAAVRAGHERVVVPAANAGEAALVPGAHVVPAHTLGQIVRRHRAVHRGQGVDDDPIVVGSPTPVATGRDLAEVTGQGEARTALEIAAAGGHHLFMVGPPGAGKTMLAECLPSLLPDLDDEAAMEVTAIESVAGSLDGGALVRRPPFVAPHHGATPTAVVGGGSGSVRPGLVSRAHRGVLFLDEAPEFPARVLQTLRQPLESGTVSVARARGMHTFPARFQLVLAANPCPCGRASGKGADCSCTPRAIRDYMGRLVGPLLDRVDLQIQVAALSRTALAGAAGESSEVVAARVAAARHAQARRWADNPWTLNAHVPGPRLRAGRHKLPSAVTRPLDDGLDRGVLTLRGYDRTLRLAWTAADLAGRDVPGVDDVATAYLLRTSAAVAA